MAYDETHDEVVLFGGRAADNSNLNETWTWDGSQWNQESPTTSPCARRSARMVWDGARIVLFGGDGHTDDDCDDEGLQDDTWLWSGTNWQRCTDFNGGCNEATQPSARESFGVALDRSNDATGGQVLMFGGNEALATYDDVPDELQPTSEPANDTWKWSPSAKDWFLLEPAHSPCTRNSAALEYDDYRDKVILYGGLAGDDCANPDDPLNDTWAWNGSDWQQCTTLCNPTGGTMVTRTGHRVAWDSEVHHVVMFGGSSDTNDDWCDADQGDLLCQDTWYINGTPWARQSPETLPQWRCCYGLAYDQLNDQLLMFGGGTFGHDSCDDTLVWDQGDWTQLGGACPVA